MSNLSLSVFSLKELFKYRFIIFGVVGFLGVFDLNYFLNILLFCECILVYIGNVGFGDIIKFILWWNNCIKCGVECNGLVMFCVGIIY